MNLEHSLPLAPQRHCHMIEIVRHCCRKCLRVHRPYCPVAGSRLVLVDWAILHQMTTNLESWLHFARPLTHSRPRLGMDIAGPEVALDSWHMVISTSEVARPAAR